MSRRNRRLQKTSPQFHLSSRWFYLTVSILSWTILVYIFFRLPPRLFQNLLLPGLYLPFFLLLFLALFSSLKFLLLHTRRSLFISLFLVTILLLRLLGFSHLLYLALTLLLFLSFEAAALYLSHPPGKPVLKSP